MWDVNIVFYRKWGEAVLNSGRDRLILIRFFFWCALISPDGNVYSARQKYCKRRIAGQWNCSFFFNLVRFEKFKNIKYLLPFIVRKLFLFIIILRTENNELYYWNIACKDFYFFNSVVYFGNNSNCNWFIYENKFRYSSIKEDNIAMMQLH